MKVYKMYDAQGKYLMEESFLPEEIEGWQEAFEITLVEKEEN